MATSKETEHKITEMNLFMTPLMFLCITRVTSYKNIYIHINDAFKKVIWNFTRTYPSPEYGKIISEKVSCQELFFCVEKVRSMGAKERHTCIVSL